jgi:hypothetical protein
MHAIKFGVGMVRVKGVAASLFNCIWQASFVSVRSCWGDREKREKPLSPAGFFALSTFLNKADSLLRPLRNKGRGIAVQQEGGFGPSMVQLTTATLNPQYRVLLVCRKGLHSLEFEKGPEWNWGR